MIQEADQLKPDTEWIDTVWAHSRRGTYGRSGQSTTLRCRIASIQ